MFPPSPYLDSEQTNLRIAQAVATLDARDFDYDGDGGLPMRPDVRDYISHFLCRQALGPLHAGGLPTPTACLNHDGTVTLIWTVAGHASTGLWLHVPCRGVVQVCKRAHGAQVEETLRHLEPHQIELALDPIFEWLRGLYAEAN
jgi:hypothetical protein